MNGYKNYETWNVSLWIANDEGLYNLAKLAGDYVTLRAWLSSEDIKRTGDGVAYDDPALDVDHLDEVVQELAGDE